MEVRVNAQGEVVIDVSNGDNQKAIELIRALQGEGERKQKSEARSASMKEAAQKVDTGTGMLNQIQYRTWQYLADNDCSDGIHVSQLAHAFGISTVAANSRLIVLFNLGYATRVKKGYYKALTPANG